MIDEGHKVLLFIGNGFDCDLGLKTKYSDFVESTYFKRNLTGNFDFSRIINDDYDFSIFDYLKYKYKENQNWIDIEHELFFLATRDSRSLNSISGKYEYHLPKSGNEQKRTFYLLKEELNDYLLNINYHINKKSYSYKLLELINKSKYTQIISFNYTNLESLCKIEGGLKNACFYVHGCLSDNDKQSIILGFQDNVEIDKSYCYMIKSHQPSYYSSHIPDIIESADEVIFFGLSLGDVDYPYFSEFFKNRCIKDTTRRFISIFTYDENSRQDILYQLRTMNNKQTRLLYEYNNLNFFRTKDKMDNYKIEGYLYDLEKRLRL